MINERRFNHQSYLRMLALSAQKEWMLMATSLARSRASESSMGSKRIPSSMSSTVWKAGSSEEDLDPLDMLRWWDSAAGLRSSLLSFPFIFSSGRSANSILPPVLAFRIFIIPKYFLLHRQNCGCFLWIAIQWMTYAHQPTHPCYACTHMSLCSDC